METLKKLLELIQFGDERIDFELKEQELIDSYCEFKYNKWSRRDFDTYISCYRFRKEILKDSYVSLDINIRSDRTEELIKKVRTQFKDEELMPIDKAKLNSNIMSLKINENTRVDFVKTNEIVVDENYKASDTSEKTITLQVVHSMR